MTVRYLIGIDEVGRGPLAGPVCVGGVAILARERSSLARLFRGVKDSKQLSERERLFWFGKICGKEISGAYHSPKHSENDLLQKIGTATVFVGPKIIDEEGISFTIRAAVAKVLGKLNVPPKQCLVLLDGGLKAPSQFLNQKTIIKGDEKEWLIALASIVAKVRRDRLMIRLAKKYPEYGFEKHKGYGTKAHYRAIRKYGLCEIHRRSFLKKSQIPNNKFQTIPKFQFLKL